MSSAALNFAYADLWEVDWKVHPRFAKVVIDGVIYAHGDSGRAGQVAALTGCGIAGLGRRRMPAARRLGKASGTARHCLESLRNQR